MSYLIKMRCRGTVQYKYMERSVPYISSFAKDEKSISIYQGEFRSTIEDLNKIDWISDHNLLIDIDAPFTIVRADKLSETINFASSIYGAVQMFYYHKDGELIISDDFWEIVNQINVSFAALDIDAIREYFLMGYPLFDGTYIKGLHVVNSGMVFRYDGKNDELSMDKYYSLRVSPTGQSIDEATQELDRVLDEGIKRIHAEMGNVRYSMGLSGGLDSRLIPHYTKQNGMRLSSYILGEPRPRKLFLSRDHRNSRQLAEIFGLKHEECKWSKEVFYDNVYWNIKNTPLTNEQFFKGRSDIHFDVLLTGGSGYFVGSTFPASLQELDEDKLAYEMHRLFRAVSPYAENLRLINAGLRILFGKEIKSRQKLPWVDKFLDADTDKKAIEKIKDFISEGRKTGKDNLSIFLDWFDFYGARNMFGGYESLSGRVRAFSIYNPYVVNTIKHWKYEFFQDRLCLKNLILEYIPEAAKVKEQKHEGRIGSKSGFFKKLFNGFLFWLFGNGNDIAGYKFKYVEDVFYKRMSNDYKWFYRIFDVRENLDDMMKFKGKGFLSDIWKVKIILDYLETGEYEKFITEQNLAEV